MKEELDALVKITKTLRVLFVEDNRDNRESTLVLLKIFFNDILMAEDGADGVKIFNTNSIDLIITDINMPKMNGIEMLEELNTDVPSIVLSAHSKVEFFSNIMKIGIDGYLIKPIETSQFILILQKIVASISLRRENGSYQKHLELEIRSNKAELATSMSYDNLTGLLNRASFYRDMEGITLPILFIIDINKFKVINEVYGSAVGSTVLKEFGAFLQNFVEDSSYKVYRLSADEFAILDIVIYIDTEKYEHDIARLFSELIEFSVDVDEHTSVSVDVTVGFSTSQTNAFESAKIALDFAKAHNKSFMTYSSNIDNREAGKNTLEWKDNIKSAIGDYRVIPVYQGIVNRDKETIKYETLMRIKDKKSGNLVSPDVFLDIAVKTRQYEKLSTGIVLEALHLLATSDHTLSMNFAYSDINNNAFMQKIEEFFKENRGVGERTIFEILESENIENFQAMRAFIARFRAFGVRFAIDDFGSGFSNFGYLLEIEPDYIKIDGSLIKDLETNPKAKILVKAIVEFSHELGFKVIAEYVSTLEIFDILKELGVDEFQGFYFHKPIEHILA